MASAPAASGVFEGNRQINVADEAHCHTIFNPFPHRTFTFRLCDMITREWLVANVLQMKDDASAEVKYTIG